MTATVTRCKLCNRIITAPDAIARGIGSTCWARVMKKTRIRTKQRKTKGRRSKIVTWQQAELPFQEAECTQNAPQPSA